MKKTPRKATTAPRAERDALRQRLHEALSDDERDVVLAAALLALDAAGRVRLLDGLDTDTRDALATALDPPSKGATRPGRRKVEQEWNTLWARCPGVGPGARGSRPRRARSVRSYKRAGPVSLAAAT